MKKRLIKANEQELEEAVIDYANEPNSQNDQELKDAVEEYVEEKSSQTHSSANTSINKNKIPALFTEILKRNGFFGNNYDNGGGKYDNVIEWYNKNTGFINRVFDLYNRTEEYNNETNKHNDYATSTLSNVLNVIDNDKDIINTLKRSKWKAPICYIKIFEGNGSGIGKESKKDCYQRNQPTKDYIPYVEEVFGKGNYSIKGDVITAFDPTKIDEETLTLLKSKKFSNASENILITRFKKK